MIDEGLAFFCGLGTRDARANTGRNEDPRGSDESHRSLMIGARGPGPPSLMVSSIRMSADVGRKRSASNVPRVINEALASLASSFEFPRRRGISEGPEDLCSPKCEDAITRRDRSGVSVAHGMRSSSLSIAKGSSLRNHFQILQVFRNSLPRAILRFYAQTDLTGAVNSKSPNSNVPITDATRLFRSFARISLRTSGERSGAARKRRLTDVRG